MVEEKENWYIWAYSVLENYLQNHQESFLTENFRKWAETREYYREPADARNWGMVMAAASKDKKLSNVAMIWLDLLICLLKFFGKFVRDRPETFPRR